MIQNRGPKKQVLCENKLQDNSQSENDLLKICKLVRKNVGERGVLNSFSSTSILKKWHF
jgi:hypothetical protein